MSRFLAEKLKWRRGTFKSHGTFIATAEIFNKIISGELDGTAAYMSGQLKIEGSLQMLQL